jgi:hypothetical protein
VHAAVVKPIFSGLLLRARQIEADFGADRSKQFRKWLSANAPSGDASVFRWVRERPPFVPAPVDEEPNICNYHDACDAKARVFTDIWEQTDVTEHRDGPDDELIWPTGLECSDFDAPLDPDGVRQQAKSFAISTSFGTDMVHPRQVTLLSDSFLWLMIDLFIGSVRMAYTPETINRILIKLIPKPDGGARPIGFFSTFIVVLMKLLRKTVGKLQLCSRVAAHWYGMKGRPASQAAWTRLTAARYAKCTRKIALANMYDVMKAFDHLDWKELLDAARGLDFPLILLRFLLHI